MNRHITKAESPSYQEKGLSIPEAPSDMTGIANEAGREEVGTPEHTVGTSQGSAMKESAKHMATIPQKSL